MSGLLLPGAQGTVCSHHYYLNHCAVLQDSKRWWNGTTRKWACTVPGHGSKCEMFHFSCLSWRGWTWRSLSAYFATLSLPMCPSFIYLFFLPAKLTGNETWEQNKRLNPRISPSLLQMPPLLHSGAIVVTLELKDPLWIMSSSVEMACSPGWEFPLNSTPSCFEWQCLWRVCAYYTGEKTWLPRDFLPNGDILPCKKQMQSDFKCSFGLLPSGEMVWKLHCEPVHAVRTVSLGVALGAEVNIMY